MVQIKVMDFRIYQQLSEISVFKNYMCGVVRFRGKKIQYRIVTARPK